jgi:hypothetical protein
MGCLDGGKAVQARVSPGFPRLLWLGGAKKKRGLLGGLVRRLALGR